MAKWKPASQRLLEKIEIDDNDCWNYTGTILKCGYGQTTLNSKKIYAHRLSYLVHFSEIPKGLFVLHKCDNRKCINPKHLFVGTAFDNMQDMVSKGRHKTKKNILMNKLNVVVKMREEGYSFRRIAKHFGYKSHKTVINALKGIYK